ncbi:hypothetical protein GCM10010922_20960 [Microbacterium sorbitolivorans]|uniref:ATP-binding protein n=1 Tax=Microbacterium sorbitolivorans TaxID=1867410 RepID=A0A367Y8C5_9MICO|nr:ATP-binding protein [Microbacterium sorbitolivorans]RCK61860.1 ATP-binding protein [Microbacterium sorbitolivorans]GGF45065.1 hypothetical protein GCM10010922_20960 [Microbacterium sorbitolivorans]
MLPSPYTPSDMPRVFIGREREREELRDTLARVIAFGDMGGPLTIVTGPRGLGKTSLLREVSANAEREGFVVAWVAGVKHQAFMTDVIDQVSRSMRRAGMGAEGRRKAKLEALTLEVGVGIAKVQAKLATAHKDPAPTGALLGPVEDFLHEASTSIRERGGAGLLIVIDELHAPLEPRTSGSRAAEKAPLLDAAILLNVIQNMSGDRARYPLAVLGAGLPQTKTALTQAATFGERIREIVLTEFDSAVSAAVLTEAARPLSVTWDPEAVALGVDNADGYPQALQLIGAETWKVARPRMGDVIRREHVEQSLPQVAESMRSMFLTRWNIATTSERAFLRAMAEAEGEFVSRAAIAERLGVESTDLSMARSSLIYKGIIEPAGRGQLRFTIPGFDAFVLDQ